MSFDAELAEWRRHVQAAEQSAANRARIGNVQTHELVPGQPTGPNDPVIVRITERKP